jgi:hypothetical protein
MIVVFAATLVLMVGKRLPWAATPVYTKNMDDVLALKRDNINHLRHFVSSTRRRMTLK